MNWYESIWIDMRLWINMTFASSAVMGLWLGLSAPDSPSKELIWIDMHWHAFDWYELICIYELIWMYTTYAFIYMFIDWASHWARRLLIGPPRNRYELIWFNMNYKLVCIRLIWIDMNWFYVACIRVVCMNWCCSMNSYYNLYYWYNLYNWYCSMKYTIETVSQFTQLVL
jgi:hypothetical protein